MIDTNHKIKIIIWNIRGLNDKVKMATIQNFIKTENSDIICLQETKLSIVPNMILMQIFRRRYDR
jgi:exonuclease III